jgi:hypothetical protein
MLEQVKPVGVSEILAARARLAGVDSAMLTTFAQGGVP